MESGDTSGNRAAQTDEMEALKSIYGEDCIPHDDNSCELFVHPMEEDGSLPPLRLCAFFPDSYPSTSEPILEMEAPWLHQELRQKLSVELHRIFHENAGNVIVFTWVEWLKEQIWLWEEARNWTMLKRGSHATKVGCEVMGSVANLDEIEGDAHGWEDASSRLLLKDAKGKNVPTEKIEEKNLEELDTKNLEELDTILGITHGDPFTEKRSTFQAHLAYVNSVDQMETVMEALLRNRKIAGATHNIMAYRISIPEKGTVLQDYDDDGETAAGGRLLHLLQMVDAINVVVVVSRWFGGILLGPDRFKHINNSLHVLF